MGTLPQHWNKHSHAEMIRFCCITCHKCGPNDINVKTSTLRMDFMDSPFSYLLYHCPGHLLFLCFLALELLRSQQPCKRYQLWNAWRIMICCDWNPRYGLKLYLSQSVSIHKFHITTSFRSCHVLDWMYAWQCLSSSTRDSYNMRRKQKH